MFDRYWNWLVVGVRGVIGMLCHAHDEKPHKVMPPDTLAQLRQARDWLDRVVRQQEERQPPSQTERE